MRHFEPWDYLASLPEPEFHVLSSEVIGQELKRVRQGEPLTGVDPGHYKIEQPQGQLAQDHGAWRKAAEAAHMQLEYNRLRITNLEMLERWGSKAWVAHSSMARGLERVKANEVNQIKVGREEVNKKRKLDQISCGNELRKLGYELEQYVQDNYTVEIAVREMEIQVRRLRETCKERGVKLDGELAGDDEEVPAEAAGTSWTPAASQAETTPADGEGEKG